MAAEVGLRFVANQYQHPRHDIWVNYDVRLITECEDLAQRKELIHQLALQVTVDLLKHLLTTGVPPS